MVVSRVTKIELGEVKERETGGIHSAGEKTSDGTREREEREIVDTARFVLSLEARTRLSFEEQFSYDEWTE